MQLIRTTIRLKENLKKRAEKKAIDENMSLQDLINRAVEQYLQNGDQRRAKKIFFKTHHLGQPLDNLTRDDFYSEPKIEDAG
jgi:hypothetical protein